MKDELPSSSLELFKDNDDENKDSRIGRDLFWIGVITGIKRARDTSFFDWRMRRQKLKLDFEKVEISIILKGACAAKRGSSVLIP